MTTTIATNPTTILLFMNVSPFQDVCAITSLFVCNDDKADDDNTGGFSLPLMDHFVS